MHLAFFIFQPYEDQNQSTIFIFNILDYDIL